MYFWCICGEEGDLRVLLFRPLEAPPSIIVLMCLSVMTNEVEYSSLCSLAIWKDSWVLPEFFFLANILNDLPIFPLLFCRVFFSFHILGMNTSLGICIANIFLLTFYTLYFHFLNSVFWRRKFLILIWPNLF